MKQRVDAEKYLDLSPAQRQALRDWWTPQEFDIVLVDHVPDKDRPGKKYWVTAAIEAFDPKTDPEKPILTTFCRRNKSELLPLLSVGQCIELLACKAPDKLLTPAIKRNWLRLVGKKPNYPGDLPDDGLLPDCHKELIDTLWDAVKEALAKAGDPNGH